MSDEAIKIEERGQRTTIKWGIGTVVYRSLVIILAASGPMLIAAFWLFSDRHNDERYVQRIEYAKDRANDERFRDQATQNINRRLDDVTTAVKEIGADVKAILREKTK